MPLTVNPTDQPDYERTATAAEQAPKPAQEAGTTGGQTEAQPLHSPNLPDPVKEGEEWQQYVPQALQGLYPHMRAGEDYVWGRKDFGGDLEMIAWNEKYQPVDMGKVEEVAKKIAERDPYVSYQPLPPLHAGRSDGTEVGEEHATPGNY
jgi:hypothetical protein